MPEPRVRSAESALYPAVKAFLEGQGYEVKAEINGCDVVGLRPGAPPVIVELKRSFSLALLLQGVDRLALTEQVYLAVERPAGRQRGPTSIHRSRVRNLCRRLGLGLMTVAPDRGARGVDVLLDPIPYTPRRRTARLARLLGEHARRNGDPNRGGVVGIPIVTAYRQEALRCAALIARRGRATLGELRTTGLVPNASRILQRDVYGWFRRVGRATYEVTDRARHDLVRFAAAGAVPELAGADAATVPQGGHGDNVETATNRRRDGGRRQDTHPEPERRGARARDGTR